MDSPTDITHIRIDKLRSENLKVEYIQIESCWDRLPHLQTVIQYTGTSIYRQFGGSNMFVILIRIAIVI